MLLDTGVQSFHIESAGERAAQWCTSDRRFPATLRTRELEVTYFSEFRRLDFQRHTRGMSLFVPSTLINPFPNSASQVEYFRAARWTSEAAPAGGLRLRGFRAGEAHEWLEIDLGPAPAKLPYACVAFRAGRGSRNGFAAIAQWSAEPGITYWTGLLYSADLGDEIEVSLYGRRHTSHVIRDNEVRLPIEAPTSIRDSTSSGLKTYPALDDLPATWRSLLRLGSTASEGSDGSRK